VKYQELSLTWLKVLDDAISRILKQQKFKFDSLFQDNNESNDKYTKEVTSEDETMFLTIWVPIFNSACRSSSTMDTLFGQWIIRRRLFKGFYYI